MAMYNMEGDAHNDDDDDNDDMDEGNQYKNCNLLMSENTLMH